MKKIFAFLFTVVLVISFTACDGAKKTKAPAEEPVKSEVVAPEPETPALSPTEMLKAFQEYAKAYGEAFNNISKDPRKFSELSKQSQKQVTDMEKIKSELNAKQLQEYQKALDIILKVNKGGK